MVKQSERSTAKITKSDLRKLLALAQEDFHEFFRRNPSYRKYERKVRIIALCQGAALHFLDGKTGVKDFDVWAFYPVLEPTLPYRRRGCIDYGPSKFGRRPRATTEGRTVDILFRSDEAFRNKDPVLGISKYLATPRTVSAKHLAAKAVIGLYPDSVFGKVLWDGS